MIKVLSILIFLLEFSMAGEGVLSEEKILLSSNEKQKHLAFPHAISDKQGSLWLVYRAAENHVGSLGTLWLAKYRLKDMEMLGQWPIYSNPIVDPRDPILHLEGDKLFVSFFQYNYIFRLVRQFVLEGSTKDGFDWSKAKPTMLDDKEIENHSSCAPLISHQSDLVLPIYYVNDFYSYTTRVGYFQINKKLKVTKRVEIQRSEDRYLLEPTIVKNPNRKKHWISLFRTSPKNEGVGSIGPMMKSESLDEGKTWAKAVDTEFKGQHPKFSVDSQKQIWAGFRDLSDYDDKHFQAKITLWNLDQNKKVTLYETQTPHKQNWDCGYPSMVEMAPGKYQLVYYYAKDGKFFIASKILENWHK